MDHTVAVSQPCKALVLNCRLFRRGEGWVTRQERSVPLLPADGPGRMRSFMHVKAESVPFSPKPSF
jgi:hypothetical protein